MSLQIGDRVRIGCRASKYNSVEGEIFKVQDNSRYAVVDMPSGTEYKLERIETNAIIERMKASEKKRKTPIARWPKGDPQWFPLEWLVLVKRGGRRAKGHEPLADQSELF